MMRIADGSDAPGDVGREDADDAAGVVGAGMGLDELCRLAARDMIASALEHRIRDSDLRRMTASCRSGSVSP